MPQVVSSCDVLFPPQCDIALMSKCACVVELATADTRQQDTINFFCVVKCYLY